MCNPFDWPNPIISLRFPLLSWIYFSLTKPPFRVRDCCKDIGVILFLSSVSSAKTCVQSEASKAILRHFLQTPIRTLNRSHAKCVYVRFLKTIKSNSSDKLRHGAIVALWNAISFWTPCRRLSRRESSF